MDEKLALKVNKFIHEQCIDGVPHDIGWNTMKLVEAETQVKLFCQPAVIKSVCCGSDLVEFNKEYNSCFVCYKLHKKGQQTVL